MEKIAILTSFCSAFQIVGGCLVVILVITGKLNMQFTKTLIGIGGFAGIVKYCLSVEPTTMITIASISGVIMVLGGLFYEK